MIQVWLVSELNIFSQVFEIIKMFFVSFLLFETFLVSHRSGVGDLKFSPVLLLPIFKS